MPSVLFRPEARQLCIPLPRNWQVVNQVGDNFLMCNEEIAINLMNGVLINPVPDSMLREYRRKRLPDKHFEEDSFTLGEYQIRHKGQWGYICQKRRNGYLEIRWARISAHRYAARGATICISGQPELAATLHFEHPYRRPNPQPADRRHDCDPAARLSCVSLHGRGTKKIPTDLRRPDQRQHSGRNGASRYRV